GFERERRRGEMAKVEAQRLRAVCILTARRRCHGQKSECALSYTGLSLDDDSRCVRGGREELGRRTASINVRAASAIARGDVIANRCKGSVVKMGERQPALLMAPGGRVKQRVGAAPQQHEIDRR